MDVPSGGAGRLYVAAVGIFPLFCSNGVYIRITPSEPITISRGGITTECEWICCCLPFLKYPSWIQYLCHVTLLYMYVQYSEFISIISKLQIYRVAHWHHSMFTLATRRGWAWHESVIIDKGGQKRLAGVVDRWTADWEMAVRLAASSYCVYTGSQKAAMYWWRLHGQYIRLFAHTYTISQCGC